MLSLKKKSKLTKIGLVMLGIGIISLAIQAIWYGYMDADGFIHDSIFLPIGMFVLVGAVIVLCIAGIRSFIKEK